MLLVDTFFYPDKMLNKSKILYSVRKHERLRGTVTGNCFGARDQNGGSTDAAISTASMAKNTL